MEIAFFWVVLAIIVGVAANTRARSFGGWFLLALVISPLLAGLLLIAMPRGTGKAQPLTAPQSKPFVKSTTVQVSRPKADTFAADGVFSGHPYRVLSDGSVEAAMPGGRVHFKNMDHFVAAATGESAA